MQGAWFQSLVKELRSHMPQDKKKIILPEKKDKKILYFLKQMGKRK